MCQYFSSSAKLLPCLNAYLLTPTCVYVRTGRKRAEWMSVCWKTISEEAKLSWFLINGRTHRHPSDSRLQLLQKSVNKPPLTSWSRTASCLLVELGKYCNCFASVCYSRFFKTQRWKIYWFTGYVENIDVAKVLNNCKKIVPTLSGLPSYICCIYLYYIYAVIYAHIFCAV